MSYLAIKDEDGFGATFPKISRKCGSKILYLTEEQSKLVDQIGQRAWASVLHKNSAYSAGYSKYTEYQNVVASTIHYYDNGLRGRQLRQQVADDYGVGIIFILQFAIIIMQIIYWIRELRKQEELNDSNTSPDFI